MGFSGFQRLHPFELSRLTHMETEHPPPVLLFRGEINFGLSLIVTEGG